MIIEFLKQLSADTVLMTTVIGVAVWILKGAMWALGHACSKLISKLIETLATVDTLKAQMSSILSMTSDVQKLKTDLDSAWGEIRRLKTVNEKH